MTCRRGVARLAFDGSFPRLACHCEDGESESQQ
jgi:hypothetical protein